MELSKITNNFEMHGPAFPRRDDIDPRPFKLLDPFSAQRFSSTLLLSDAPTKMSELEQTRNRRVHCSGLVVRRPLILTHTMGVE